MMLFFLMFVLVFVVVIGVFLQFVGCSGGFGFQSGQVNINVNGVNCDYIFCVFDGYDGSVLLKFIFGFYWFGGFMNDVVNGWYGFEGLF